MISITIPGEPATITAQQKGVRVIAGQALFYTKAAVTAEKRRIRAAIHPRLPAAPLEGPLFSAIRFVHPLTQQLAARHVGELSNPTFHLFHDKRPDVDNLTKLVLDALTADPKRQQKGVWRDDGQVCVLLLGKVYGSEPRIEIDVAPITGLAECSRVLNRWFGCREIGVV